MTIPFVDLKAQYERLRLPIEERMRRVLEHGQFINGPEIEEFEHALATFAGCTHAVGVSSGTDALLIALMASGIGPGDAVFIPSFTFTSTAEVTLLLGATPIFVDISESTFNLAPDDFKARVEMVIKKGRLRPAAAIPVDLFGLPADYARINKIADEFELFVLADAAQSFGARAGDRRVGSLAPVTATSFFPAKPLGCFGDGGALFTSDEELAGLVRSIRSHGQGEHRYDIVRVGVNGRLDTIQAAVLLAKLEVFEDELAAREQLARRYDEGLAGHVTLPPRAANDQSAWAQYSILVDNRDELAARLRERGIPTAVYYPRPLHLQPAYEGMDGSPGWLPVSEDISKRILSLPMHAYMPEDTASMIIDAVVAAQAETARETAAAERRTARAG